MKKKILPLLFGLLTGIVAHAQSPGYALASIPEKIKNKAAVVVHYEEINFEIESIDKARLRSDRIFTVLNEEGKDALFLTLYSSKTESIEDAEIKLFDASGKQTARYKKKDMRTQANGEGLIVDGNMTYYYIPTSSYPVTVEFKYEMKYNGTLNIPTYHFIHSNEGVLNSTYTARVPADLGFRYKACNTDISPVLTEEGKYKTYKWNVKNLEPISREAGSASSIDKYPHIQFATDQFSVYGLQGDFSSWKNFGLWLNDLYKGLDELPADRQQFFQQMVKDAPSEKEKMRRIYNYLQQNFRYVSIQLGIGGYKPFPADFTDKKKYGDCKGLSNYMKAALKAVGIRSHVAIINAEYDEEPVDPSFPNNGFNHVILCVPLKNDTTWLECTSSTNDFGELGTFTENRYALLVTDEGGALVPTPKSNAAANAVHTLTTVSVEPDFGAISETFFTARGEYREMLADILKEKRDDQKRIIVSYLGYKQPDDFEFVHDASYPGYRAVLKMSFYKMSDFGSGNKLFMSARPSKIWSSVLPNTSNRRLDFFFRFPFEKTDTTIIKLPAGAKPDALPKETALQCNYASFHSKCWYEEKENAVYSVSNLVLTQHRIPAADYAQVKKFFDDVMQEDAQKLVVNKEEAAKRGF